METAARTPLGKQIKGNRYFHVTSLEELDLSLRERVQFAVTRAGLSTDAEFNVIKINGTDKQISLSIHPEYEHRVEQELLFRRSLLGGCPP